LIATGAVGPLVPAGTPRAIIDQIARATHTTLADRACQQMLIEADFEPTPDSSPEKIPADVRGRHCTLDVTRQSARTEDRLSFSKGLSEPVLAL
jgi:hypothetical protein